MSVLSERHCRNDLISDFLENEGWKLHTIVLRSVKTIEEGRIIVIFRDTVEYLCLTMVGLSGHYSGEISQQK